MSVKGMRSNSKKCSINEAIKMLKDGELILYPTDSVWAIGCDVSNEVAYERIVSLKGKEYRKKMVIIVDTIERLKQHIVYIHPRVETLLTYHHKPLTIIYDGINLPDHVVSPDGSVAIRVAHHPVCQQLISALNSPLIATMAPGNSEQYATNAMDIREDIVSQLPMLLDDEITSDNKWQMPSVMATFTAKGELEFIRK